jgi:hypothetical protein
MCKFAGNMKLKADEITGLQDARFCSAEGFSALSFNFVRGDSGRLAPEMIQEIVGWLSGTDCYLKVGEEFGEVDSIPDNLVFQGIESGSLEALKAHPDRELVRILRIDAFHSDTPEGVMQQIPASRLTSDMDLSKVWVELASVTDLSYLKGLASPYGLSFSVGFRDEDGMLDFDRIHEVLDQVGV